MTQAQPAQFPAQSGPRGGRGGERAMVPPARPTSYYGHPVIKRPVWKPDIALYFYTGGLAGGSMMLAAAARRQGRSTVARRALLTAFAGVSLSPVFLIRDLGKPLRFYNMLRVMKVTSPMSMGTWILTGAGGFTTIATGCELLGMLPRVRNAAEVAAACLGGPLSTYTAALISDTAVPVWHQAGTELPLVFAGTALATAGAASLVMNEPSDSATARTLAVGGALGSLATLQVMERRLGELAEPYHEERVATVAKALTAAGALTVAVAGRRRLPAVLGGLCVLGGGLLERWSIFKAGQSSASDPKFTVQPQRARLQRGHGHRQSETHGVS